MKKLILNLTFLVLANIVFTDMNAQAVWRPDGTTIEHFSAKDMNDATFSSQSHTQTGKHFIIDISATWCPPCWTYHNTHVLADYYNMYGPNGTASDDAQVLYYEADQSTTDNDMNGVGTNTRGDWVSGTPYLLFNEQNPGNVFWKFLDPSSTSISYPTVFVVCSDAKMYRLSTNVTNVADVRTFVEQKCGLAPLSTQTVHSMNFSYEFYPNPSSGELTLDVNFDKAMAASYAVFNSTGQKVIQKDLGQQEGKQSLVLDLTNQPTGIYFVQAKIGNEMISEKVVLQR